MAKKKIKNGFLDLLGLGTKTTIYHVSAARKGKGRNRVSKSSWKHKGYTIYKREDGEFEVPRMDRDSYFNSIFDAKQFIDANTKKGMVNGMKVKKNKGRRNPSLSSFIPIKGIRKNADGSISLLVDSAKKAIKPITGMLKGAGKVIGNPSSTKYQLVGYQVEELHKKEYYYNSAGDRRKVKWNIARGKANFIYRNSGGMWKYGKSPVEWLNEIGANSANTFGEF